MLNLAVQVSVKSRYSKPKKQNQKAIADKTLLPVANTQRNLSLWNDYFSCKKPYCFTCIQAGIKETEYKTCGNDCLVKHWIKIYGKTYGKIDAINGVNNKNSSHTLWYLYSPSTGQSPRVRVKNFLFLWNRGERKKRKDQAWRRLATKNKIAQLAGYNLPSYQEKRTIEELLKEYNEYSYLTGKPLGSYYLSTLDLDLKQAEFPEKLVAKLVKQVDSLIGSLRVSYDQTKKGLHIDILTPKPLPNELIYYYGWGRKWIVGSIQSQGKYVVGEDKNKQFIKNGKWYWKTSGREEIKKVLAKFFFMAGKQVSNPVYEVTNKTERATKNSTSTQFIQAKILSIKKTCLADFLKVFYQSSRQKSYFLLNTYQRPNILPNIQIGSTRSMLLVNGTKHSFISFLPPPISINKRYLRSRR